MHSRSRVPFFHEFVSRCQKIPSMIFRHGRINPPHIPPKFPKTHTRYSRFLPLRFPSTTLRHQLDDTTGLGDLLLRKLADVPGADDDRDLGDAALAEDLGIAEREEVEDGGGVLLLAGEVGLAGLGGDEGPQLFCALVSCPSRCGEQRRFYHWLQFSGVRDRRTLSMFIVGDQKWLGCLWKYLIPTLPKYP